MLKKPILALFSSHRRGACPRLAPENGVKPEQRVRPQFPAVPPCIEHQGAENRAIRQPVRFAVRILLDGLIGLHIIGLAALLWTGGYSIDLFGATIKSHSLLPVVRGLVVLVLLRVLVVSGSKRFALLVISMLACLLVAELVVRVWDPPLSQRSLLQIHRPSDLYDWELVPGSRGVGALGEIVEINSLGFRERERRLPAQTGVFRVAVLGDSFTFGMSVDLEDTYVKQLERILAPGNMGVETLNFGVIGYHMWQYGVLLEHEVIRYDPDLIVMGLFLDDITVSVPPYASDSNWTPHNPFEELIPDKNKGSASKFWNLARNWNEVLETKYRYKRGAMYLQGITERKRLVGPENPSHEYYRAQTGRLSKRQYREFQTALREFGAMAATHGIPVMVMYIPDASQLHERERQHANQFVKEAALAAGVHFVDTTPAFEREPDAGDLYLFPLDAHTSPKGHRLMAQVLAEAIAERSLGSRSGGNNEPELTK